MIAIAPFVAVKNCLIYIFQIRTEAVYCFIRHLVNEKSANCIFRISISNAIDKPQ